MTRPNWSITGATAVYGLLGRPVHHSLSPQIHNLWFELYGIDAVYVALEIDQLNLSALPLAGVNLTVPFKADAVAQIDVASALVTQLGAANTVVRRDGQLSGDNTDVTGFISAFEDTFGADLSGRRVMVLGAGGAARAVAAGAAIRGAASVCFANRTPGRSQSAVDLLAPHHPATNFTTTRLAPSEFSARASATDLVVNCTTGPAAMTIRGFSIADLPSEAIWVDINYWMEDPPQIEACKQRGLQVQDGGSMLLYQAAQAFQLFTGESPDVKAARVLLRSQRRT